MMEKMIRGIATKRADDQGYIVLLDAGDLTNWLRQEHALTTAELKVVYEVADHIDGFALEVLTGELDRQSDIL
jgi:hypothetical protein